MNCIRCGRKTDGASFCEECKRIVEVPLEESPYLSTHIQIPTHRQTPPQTPVVKEKQQKKHKPRSRTGLIVAVVILSLLCAALAAVCARDLYDEWFGTDATKGQQVLLQDENTRLAAAKAELEKELVAAQTGKAELQEKISALNKRILELEQELGGSREEGSQTDLALREKEEEIRKLTEELTTAEEEVTSLEAKIRDVQAELDDLSDENTGLRTQLSSLQSDMSFLKSRIAFINTGSKTYHTYDCPYFTTDQSWIAYNVSNAKQNGYVPCTHCH